ncbi:phytosulfokines-like [Olea europaea var. sylvestris]|uniref:phytosulfokines-like n=1 Tax=Olea europaea var. sylvestris TaxID=158386 RepID=UPI000C1D7ADD|nr:phytosulfokines-like [Olea europaea var. sylvestris]
MSKVIALCVITLLFLTLSHTCARPEPTFHDITPMETHKEDHEEHMTDMDQKSCDGIGEDECMMRRTLEAHLDYIYTQKQNQP